MADAKVVFPRSLYRPEAVEAAVRAYLPLMTGVAIVREHEIVAEFRELPADLPDVLDAFCNHALVETVRLERVA